MINRSYLRNLLIVLLFFATTNLYGQDTSVLKFQSGNVSIPVSEFSDKTFHYSESELVEGYYFRIIQFSEIPSTKEKEELKLQGISLLNYIPNNAYYAKIKSSVTTHEIRKFKISAIVKIENKFKLSKDLLSENYFEWAERGTRIKLNALFFTGVSESIVLQGLTKLSAEIAIINQSQIVSFEIEKARLLELYSLPYFYYFEQIDAPGMPENLVGATNHRSNNLATAYSNGLKYNGTGVTVMLQDNSKLDQHIDYTGRFTDINATQSGDHGEHCGGTIAGAGNIDPIARGMAYGANVLVYNSSNNNYNDVPTLYNSNNLTITSKSYSNGTNAGYTTLAAQLDGQIRTLPSLMHVFSAGNSNGGGSTAAGSQWFNITGGHKAAKNVIAVANLTANDVVSSSSSRGPAADGRIKPDIGAVGTSVYSTIDPNSYGFKTGTSMACPGVAGTLAQLYHGYKDLNAGVNPPSGLIKASVLNTGDELGNAGPDFIYGWGRINARRAFNVISNNQYLSSSISQGGSNSHNITVPAGTEQVRIMVYWNDYEGAVSASPALVNDINIVVEDPSLTTYNPWVLDPTPNATTLNLPAVRGIDNLNNMEQVTIDAPAAGVYGVNVSGFSIPQGPQTYFLVYEFVTDDVVLTYPIGGEGFDPNVTEKIRWDAFGNSGTFTLEYSDNNGSTWNTIANGISASQRYFDWNVPSIVTGQALVRVTRGASTSQSHTTFSIIGVPTGLAVDFACPDSVRLIWNAVSGATAYEVSMLGAMYMDSIGTSTTNSHIISGLNPTDTYWFSVKALGTGIEGRRAIAIKKDPGTFSCPIAVDGGVVSFVSPSGGVLLDCHNNSAVPITVTIENKGLNAISNFNVSYSVNGSTVITETVSGPIAPLAQVNYTFAGTVDLSLAGNYSLQSWTDVTSDGNTFNDTNSVTINVVASGVQSIPFFEDFESFSACVTTNDCEATTCTLNNGFVNTTNGDGDDIDWRTDAGGTPSTGTGPSVDHSPGTAGGNYLYTEASGAPVCANKTAMMISPCIDLNGASSPELRFWYYMEGVSMGSLHVDIYSGGIWTNDVVTAISGDQGANWLQASVDLTAYVNQIINFRIRGVTGSNWESDIAIDDISVIEAAAPPLVAFTASNTETCQNKTITFTDNSLNNPTAWTWSFSPNTISYVNGTNANSQNPQVQFNALGSYDVTLQATNSFGNNSVTQISYININAAASIAVAEDFQSGFVPGSWSLTTSPSGLDWIPAVVTGSDGLSTTAGFVNNYVSNFSGEETAILTMPIDLSTAEVPYVTFDVSYAPYSTTLFDGLRVDVSVDCAESFSPTTYFKEGTTLETVPAITSSFSPTAASEWRRDSVDLSAYAGSNVNISFVNINGYGNGLFIDNILVEDLCSGYAINSSTITNNTCHGASVGSVDIELNAGNAPFNYSWSNGSTNQDALNLAAGSYDVTVTDVNGCVRNGSYVITEGVEIIATTSKQNVNCNGSNDGSISVSAGGGVAPYSYSWNTVPVQTTTSISGLGPAYYTVTITDNIGCTKTTEVRVREPEMLLAFAVPASPTAPNFNNGEINLLVTGGIAPYTYTWSNAAMTEDIINLTSGTYFCTVVDRRGCAVLVTVVLTNSLFAPNEPDREWNGNFNSFSDAIVYPNPTQGKLTIDFLSKEKSNVSIFLYDMKGTLLISSSQKLHKGANQIKLNLSKYPPGEYLLKIKDDNAVLVRKIILEK